ncbi:MAG TPA: transglutaminase-like domain-containing protein [Alphaproteobacteria bacterium]|jgi:regulator of sirC expression with transglutaminase-like and TPR domain
MTGGLPASKDIEAALAGLATVPDDDVDLAETALMLAALERPRVAFERYRLHLADLAEAVGREAMRRRGDIPPFREDAKFELDARIGALIAVIAEANGYRGDELTYDDLQNANLMRVIDRRRGLPVALGILYIHAARAQGWSAHGLNFPAHFLVALEISGERAIVDPFRGTRVGDAGALRSLLKTVLGADAELSPAHCATLANRAVLLRLQNNIKSRLAAQGRSEKAAAVVDRMLLFAPNQAALWQEAGALHAKIGNLRAAAAALERFMELTRDPVARAQAAQALQALRRQMN